MGEAGETEVWLDISRDTGYLSEEQYDHFVGGYDEVNKMLYSMTNTPEKSCKPK